MTFFNKIITLVRCLLLAPFMVIATLEALLYMTTDGSEVPGVGTSSGLGMTFKAWVTKNVYWFHVAIILFGIVILVGMGLRCASIMPKTFENNEQRLKNLNKRKR